MMRKPFLLSIIFYQRCISPHFPSSCRFSPTCSQYAYEAIVTHGIIKGIFLSAKRLLRCNPFFKGGYDPVPQSCCKK